MGIFNHYLIAVFTATAQEGELLGNYLCCGAGLVVLIYPLAVCLLATSDAVAAHNHVHIRQCGELTEDFYTVPVGPGLFVTIPITVLIAGGDRKFGNYSSAG